MMKEHFTNHFVKYFFGSLLCGVVFIGFSINKDIENEKIETRNKINWFYEHGCVHHGYVGSKHPVKLYKCGEQLLIWRDIPTE